MDNLVWNDQQLKEALCLDIFLESKDYGRICFNSNDVREGDIFIALRGKRDGHLFAKDALDAGASLLILSCNIGGIPSNKILRVEDTYLALEKLANYKRSRSKAKFIAVTGSVGKTSTKEAIKLALSVYGKVYASPKSFNNDLGVNLTLASIPNDTDYVIVEMGMNKKGEISELSKKVKPDIALITSIGNAHMEFFDSLKEIASAKCEIFDGLKKGGFAIINRDIKSYDYIDCIHKKITFGENINSDIRMISHETSNNLTKMKYLVDSKEYEILVGEILPKHMGLNLAALLATLFALNLPTEPAIRKLYNFTIPLGRGRLISCFKDKKRYTIISDYYNSNPISLKASLIEFKKIKYDRKIMILGDMGELGINSQIFHKEILEYINVIEAKVFLIGSEMLKLRNMISAKFYSNIDDLIQEIDNYLLGDEIILIKGSRSMYLEKVAQYLGVDDVL